MITTLLFDLSNTILFPKDKTYVGSLNKLHQDLLKKDPNYDFSAYFELDQELVNYLETLADEFTLAMFTSETIQNHPAIRPQLDTLFSSIISGTETGHSKKDPNAYHFLAQFLGVQTYDILFIDDNPECTAAAKTAGCEIHNYQHFAELKTLIESKKSLT